MYTDVDWSQREAHMYGEHGVTTAAAEEALADPNRVVIEPDYASISGQSVRVIGFSYSMVDVLSIIVVKDEGKEYGASGWVSNAKDRNIYYRKGESDEQAE